MTIKERWLHTLKALRAIYYTWYLGCIDVAWTDDDNWCGCFFMRIWDLKIIYLSREKRLKRAHKESRLTISCHPLKQTMSLYKFTVAVSPAHIFKIFSTNKVGTSIQRCENFSSILRTWLRVCSVCFGREEANKAAETKRDIHGKTLTPGHLLTLPSLAPFPSNIWDNKSLLCNKLAWGLYI